MNVVNPGHNIWELLEHRVKTKAVALISFDMEGWLQRAMSHQSSSVPVILPGLGELLMLQLPHT